MNIAIGNQLDPWARNPTNFNLPSTAPPYNPPPANAGPSRQNSGLSNTSGQYGDPNSTHPKTPIDPIIAFLTEMPSAADNPTRVAIWTELVRFKTRSLELQIAEAKKKEREAELELAKFQALTAGGPGGSSTSLAPVQPTQPFPNYTTPAAMPTSAAPIYPYYQSSVPSQPNPLLQAPLQSISSNSLNMPMNQTISQNNLTPNDFAPQSMTPFDLHAITENFDDMFNWLPDFDQNGNLVASNQMGVAPSALQIPPIQNQTSFDIPTYRPEPATTPMSHSTPIKRQVSSGGESVEDEQPTAKKSKRTSGKKVTVEVSPTCSKCKAPMGKMLVRAPQGEMPDPITTVLRCLQCRPVDRPAAVGDAGLGGPAIGTAETRKRQRIAMEAEDEESRTKDKRQFCDVCQRIIGSGQIKGGKENIGYLTEVVCHSCDNKYQRCTDCGGGGGPRQGIGKWRLKQVFQPGRKTCSLSHSRLGDRPREIGVHVTPSDFTPEQFKEVITRCKALWQEKNLSRLAVPEMMEIDLPPNIVNPLQSYADIENQITGNWPSREHMIRAEGADPARFKRILGLTWAHAKPRRGARTVDLEEEYHKVDGEEEEDNSTVLDNIKKTSVVIPAGCELIGMWGGEWDMHHGSILVSTFIPFEGTDGEDSTALSVGEIITKVQSLQQSMNTEREITAQTTGIKIELVPQVEHLWVVSGGTVPLVRERMADILIRKRSFVHVEEYLTRHPSFSDALKARPYGLHPTDGALLTVDGQPSTKPLVLVRWLGKNFDAQKILEIKQMEFGGKTKPKKKSKPKA